ncbi:hypothetical protein QN277_007434 [Acacia crassicarpa]|uniref:Uncharacterized protein n=1 Tax=Acacia crassicarpa TaxID=499986 RepID=A0AAE1MFD4_9FABA|nr:hypothetical protein QN277_007434 [Acacia crassicarpa]
MTPEKDNSKLTFPQFDVVSDMSHHHFLGRDPTHCVGNRFLRVISKEWRILQENLPESIFVRVPETRSVPPSSAPPRRPTTTLFSSSTSPSLPITLMSLPWFITSHTGTGSTQISTATAPSA